MTEHEAWMDIQKSLAQLTTALRQQAEQIAELDQVVSERLLDHYQDDDLVKSFAEIISRPGDLTERDLQEISVLNRVMTRREKAN